MGEGEGEGIDMGAVGETTTTIMTDSKERTILKFYRVITALSMRKSKHVFYKSD